MAADLVTAVSTKGQVILLKAIRDRLHRQPGTRLVVEQTEQGVLLKSTRAIFAPTRPEDVFRCLAYEGAPKSLEEMAAHTTMEAPKTR